MSKYFLDTNVLIDMTSSARPGYEAMRRFVSRALLSSEHSLCALASSLKDVYYIFERHYGLEQEARDTIKDIRDLIDVVDLTTNMIDKSLCSDEPDFEDGLIRAAAETTGADYIVTRDQKAYRTSCVRPISPVSAASGLEP